jgi:VIT1/CCC1 family predicted Fe2+/Mn2+ transporter
MSRHTVHRPAERHPGHREVSGGLARAAVFGMSDGLTSNVLLVIGFAGSHADGEWISISAQNELVSRELEVERRELERNSESEQAELAGIYRSHGMERDTAARAASEVMRDHERALTVHAREEFGLDPHELPSAMYAAVLSFVCFVAGAALPVVPWLIGSGNIATIWSIVLGVVAAGALGWAIGQFAERQRARSAVRQVAILLGACVVTYSIGKVLGVQVS